MKRIKSIFAPLAAAALLTTGFSAAAHAGGHHRHHTYAIGNCWANNNCARDYGYRHHRGYRHYRGHDTAKIIGGMIVGGIILNQMTRPRYHHHAPPPVVYRQAPPTVIYQTPPRLAFNGYAVVGNVQEAGTNISRPIVQGFDGQLCVAVQNGQSTAYYDINPDGTNINYGSGPLASNVCRTGPR